MGPQWKGGLLKIWGHTAKIKDTPLFTAPLVNIDHFTTTNYNEHKLDQRLTLALMEDKLREELQQGNCGLTDMHKALEEEQEWDDVEAQHVGGKFIVASWWRCSKTSMMIGD